MVGFCTRWEVVIAFPILFDDILYNYTNVQHQCLGLDYMYMNKALCTLPKIGLKGDCCGYRQIVSTSLVSFIS